MVMESLLVIVISQHCQCSMVCGMLNIRTFYPSQKILVSNITILKLIPTIWQLTHYLKEFLNDYGGLSVIHLCRSSLCLGRLFIDFWDGFHLLSVSWCFQTSVMLDCQNERSPNFLWSEAGLEKRERLIHQQRVIELMSLCCTVFLKKNQCCLFWERRTDCKKMVNFNEWKFNSFLDNWYGLQMRPIFIYCIFGAVNGVTVQWI